MLKSLLIVGAGSFVGGALRYLISAYMKNIYGQGQGFPWGTLAVNLLGCFAFGILFAAFSKHSATDNTWYLLLTTGVCGGFTTFSTFASESVQMLQQGNTFGFVGYVAASIILGFLLIALGYWLVSKF
ncbi:MAG: fluoride efflux transporter CrcB [Paludibacteraceae bacterium]|nr:fluoride efflux transporter CrcB [Paludibacteraceae bacterium]